VISFLFLSSFAQAQEYFHFDSIAQNSTMFMKSSEIGINNLSTLQGTLASQQSLSTALRSTSVMLKSSALSEWTAYIAQESEKNTAKAEVFLTAYQTDYGNAYEKKALEYLKSYPNAQSCKSSPFGGSTCQGTDISPEIGKKLDQDTELVSIIDEINARIWPTPKLPTKEADVIKFTGTANYIQLDFFISKLFKKKIAGHHTWYAKSFSSLDPQSSSYKKDVDKLYDNFEKRLHDDQKSIEKSLKIVVKKMKKKDPRFQDFGFCGNPTQLGGCKGINITDDVFSALADNKKAVKIIQKAQ